MSRLKIVFCVLLLSTPTSVMAKEVVQDTADLARDIFNQNVNGSGLKTDGQDIQGATNQNTVNPGARTGQASQSSGAGANAAAAAALLAACLAPCPKCLYPLCAMAALAAQQSGHDSGAASQSARVARESNYADPADPTNPDPSQGNGGFADDIIGKAKDKLEEGGYKLADGGIVFPDGSIKPVDSLNSTAAMIAAGIDPAVAEESGRVLAAVNQELAKVTKPTVSGVDVSSAGGAGSSSYSDSDSSNSSMTFSNPFAAGRDKAKSLVAGKTILLGGEPIGVAGNNIFDMIHAAYNRRRAGQQFIESAGSSTPVRMPASHRPVRGRTKN